MSIVPLPHVVLSPNIFMRRFIHHKDTELFSHAVRPLTVCQLWLHYGFTQAVLRDTASPLLA